MKSHPCQGGEIRVKERMAWRTVAEEYTEEKKE
jgi:hypothetical protein